MDELLVYRYRTGMDRAERGAHVDRNVGVVNESGKVTAADEPGFLLSSIWREKIARRAHARPKGASS